MFSSSLATKVAAVMVNHNPFNLASGLNIPMVYDDIATRLLDAHRTGLVLGVNDFLYIVNTSFETYRLSDADADQIYKDICAIPEWHKPK